MPAASHAPNPSVFALPDHLSHKASSAVIAADEQHFAAITRTLESRVADLSARLDARRREPAGRFAQTIERDADIRRLVAELATLRRFGLDLCIGHIALTGGERVYVGRIGLIDESGTPLLVDWRTPAAEPYFAATLAAPGDVVYRRRYRWSGGRIVDLWDEVLVDDDNAGTNLHTAPDDQSAFVTSLSGARTGRMRDVLSTIQSDQDAIIRADATGALVVDGGPGTGKTVVAMHRAAFLLHEQSRSGISRGNLLLVGPHRPYLDYVSDVLPALGEHSVQTATVADLAGAALAGAALELDVDELPDEADPDIARLKSGVEMVDAIDTAVRFYEEPPTESMVVQTEWLDLRITPADWAEAFTSVEEGTPHNEAHDQIWDTLVEILLDKAGAGAALRAELAANVELRRTLARAWPMISPVDLVGDLWTVPAYLRLCAPWLTADQLRALQRPEPQAWTTADLPLLDTAQHRLGDADRARRGRRRQKEQQAELELRRTVIDEAIAADDDPEGVTAMLRHTGMQEALLDPGRDEPAAPTGLAGQFGHIIVDEAQELTDAQWRMLLRRCPSGSLTVVGDRAQSRGEFGESWSERLGRVGLSPESVRTRGLSINYRTPSEVMDAAAPVIRAVRPDANVPESVRSSGVPVEYGSVDDLARVLDEWLAESHDGVACAITAPGAPLPDLPATDRIRALSPAKAKGLEFDLVVLVDPDSFGPDVTGAVDRYVAMTRSTQRLVVLR
ncbi:DNA helicase [Dietzia sp. NCCP-2495]|uniref:RNA polymerase recycling motor ATPase HelR n=1 Tax=Dietzia sp. NCCP-2495 TaxID=2934675 RepID=UPI00223192E5|nr:RNA polymerase recycling motor ATPase HelR [Dietzia sp. NCCP-2495]GLB64578.1 DNA helicase [Dietzia sp. NCCP-2495]